jgi:hypothetical protein
VTAWALVGERLLESGDDEVVRNDRVYAHFFLEPHVLVLVADTTRV